jgi:hypothetical protein
MASRDAFRSGKGTAPLEDTMHSAIFGFDGTSITGLADRTVELRRNNASQGTGHFSVHSARKRSY